MTGTAIAQVVPIIISPILTRLYTPNDFGMFATYLSLLSIILVVSTLRYELTIVLPESNEDANNLVVITIIISSCSSLILFFLVFLFGEDITRYINKPEFYIWLFSIPITVFFYGLYQALSLWLNRKKEYKYLAINKVMQTTSCALFNIIFSFSSGGLIIGNTIGQFIALCGVIRALLYRDKYKEIINSLNVSNMKLVFFRYTAFMKFSTFSAFCNSFTNIGLPLVIGMFYNSSVVGMYYLGYRMVKLPLNIIFTSLSQVYYQKAATLSYDNKQELLVFTNEIQKKIMIILFPILIVIIISAPFVFSFVFGHDWIVAGEYVKYYAIYIFFNSLVSPISSICDVLGLQKQMLLFNISLALSQIVCMAISSYFFDFGLTILIVSIVGAIHFIILDYFIKIKIDDNFKYNIL